MKNAVLTFALAVLLAAMFTGCGPREVVEAPDYEYRIGALLDLSGPNASAGAIELTAIRAAVEVANAKLEASGSRMSFTVLSCDTAGNPGNAMQCMRGLVSRKVIAVIGPSSDAEMTAVKPEANRSGVMLLSYGGGSTSHSVESDYVLRLVPDYSQQAALLVDMVQRAGVTDVVLLRTDDKYSLDISSDFVNSYVGQGGRVPAVAEIKAGSTSQQATAAELAGAVSSLIDGGKPETVAFLSLCGRELPYLVSAALSEPSLARVKWFGCHAAMQADLGIDERVGAFLEHVGFVFPAQVPFEGSATHGEVLGMLKSRTADEIPFSALFAYDACRIACEAIARTGRTPYTSKLVSEAIKVSREMAGATGDITLADSGDRAKGAFALHTVKGGRWLRTSDWATGSGGIKMLREYGR